MSSFPFSVYSFAYAPYGSISLTDTSPAQTFLEPLTYDEVRTYLKMDDLAPLDQSQKDELNGYISAARFQAESIQRRDLVRKQLDLNFDYWPTYQIQLRAPLAAVQLVQYKDSAGNAIALVANTDYVVDIAKKPGVVMPPYNRPWPSFTPWPSSAILIRFTCGYLPTDPYWLGAGSLVKKGMLLLISHWYNKRLPFERGITPGSEYAYAVSQCFATGGMTPVY